MQRLVNRTIVVMAIISVGLGGLSEQLSANPVSAHSLAEIGFVIETTEYALTPNQMTVPADVSITMTIDNQGVETHNVTIDALALSVDIPAGEVRSVTLRLPEGVYEIVCTMPGHQSLGMMGTIVASRSTGTIVAAVASPIGTADDSTASEPGSVRSMLNHLPILNLPDDRPIAVGYSDFARQFAAIGLDPAADSGERWVASLGLFHPDGMDVWQTDDWQATIGFGVDTVDQIAQTGFNFDAGTLVTILRGQFDQAAMERNWEGLGYQRLDLLGRTVYQYSDDPNGLDFTIPYDLEIRSYLNIAVFLRDGSLAFANTLDGMNATLAVEDGTAPSLAQRTDVAQLLAAARSDLTSAIVIDGRVFEYHPEAFTQNENVPPELQERIRKQLEEAAAQESVKMPRISSALFGVTVGGPLPDCADGTCPNMDSAIPDAVFEMALLVADPQQAKRASTVVATRFPQAISWTTRSPYSGLMTLLDTGSANNSPVALIHFTQRYPGHWISMLYSHDFPFLLYLSDEP